MKLTIYCDMREGVRLTGASLDTPLGEVVMAIFKDALAWLDANAISYDIDLSDEAMKAIMAKARGIALPFDLDIPDENQAVLFKLWFPDLLVQSDETLPHRPKGPFAMQVAYPSKMLDDTGNLRVPVNYATVALVHEDGYANVEFSGDYDEFVTFQKDYL